MSKAGIKAVFDRSARTYDRARWQLVPCFNEFYGTLLDLVPAKPGDSVRVLDLGAGTGLLSLFIAERFPRAELTLVDVSEAMLAIARDRFAGRSTSVHFLVSNYAADLLPEPFDVVASALSIHHLTDREKAGLFRKLNRLLVPGGVFINADQVLGPTPAIEQLYRDTWLRQVRERGVSPEDLAAALERMKEDRMATLEAQLSWLREAGFVEVDSWYKNLSFGVFGGAKPLPSARAT